MDSILEFDTKEIKQFKNVLKSQDGNGQALLDTFVQYAPQLFQNSFQMLLSSGAKEENFTLIKQMAESQDDELQTKIDQLFDLVLNICAAVIKCNTQGQEEFTAVLNDLNVDQSVQKDCLKVFQQEYLDKIKQINNVYEDAGEDSAMNQKFSKKLPLNLAVADDAVAVSNPQLVDCSWEIIYTLSSQNLNKLFQPRFLVTLTFLTQQDASLQEGLDSMIQWSSKRNNLKLKRMSFECDQTELTHMLFKVKSATNSLEQMLKVPK